VLESLRDGIESFRTKEGVKVFATGIWVVATILTTISYIGAIEVRSLPQQYWASESPRHVLGFPSWKEPEYKLFITEIGPNAGSIKVTVEQINGWRYEGTFYLGDTIAIDRWRVLIKEINMDRPKPILLEYYQLVDVKLILTVSLIVLSCYLLYSLLPSRKRKVN